MNMPAPQAAECVHPSRASARPHPAIRCYRHETMSSGGVAGSGLAELAFVAFPTGDAVLAGRETK